MISTCNRVEIYGSAARVRRRRPRRGSGPPRGVPPRDPGSTSARRRAVRHLFGSRRSDSMVIGEGRSSASSRTPGAAVAAQAAGPSSGAAWSGVRWRKQVPRDGSPRRGQRVPWQSIWRRVFGDLRQERARGRRRQDVDAGGAPPLHVRRPADHRDQPLAREGRGARRRDRRHRQAVGRPRGSPGPGRCRDQLDRRARADPDPPAVQAGHQGAALAPARGDRHRGAARRRARDRRVRRGLRVRHRRPREGRRRQPGRAGARRRARGAHRRARGRPVRGTAAPQAVVPTIRACASTSRTSPRPRLRKTARSARAARTTLPCRPARRCSAWSSSSSTSSTTADRRRSQGRRRQRRHAPGILCQRFDLRAGRLDRGRRAEKRRSANRGASRASAGAASRRRQSTSDRQRDRNARAGLCGRPARKARFAASLSRCGVTFNDQTSGDLILDAARQVGGKALFVKEIEQALLDRRPISRGAQY